jgi:hypothetical protein
MFVAASQHAGIPVSGMGAFSDAEERKELESRLVAETSSRTRDYQDRRSSGVTLARGGSPSRPQVQHWTVRFRDSTPSLATWQFGVTLDN